MHVTSRPATFTPQACASGEPPKPGYLDGPVRLSVLPCQPSPAGHFAQTYGAMLPVKPPE